MKGHRPTVGTRDCKDLLYVFAVVNVVTGGDARQPPGEPGRRQEEDGQEQDPADAGGVRRPPAARRPDLPEAEHKRVVLIIDNAPWHRGKPIDEALADHPHLEFKRLPSYSPQLNVIERFWKLLRRRATHNRLFAGLAELKRSLRASLCYYQTVRGKIRGLIAGCYAPPQNRQDQPERE